MIQKRWVDLHLHSTFSDGHLPVHRLADTVARAGVALAALSDHDTLEGVPLFERACRRLGVAAVSAVEISTLLEWQGTAKEVHVLAYGLAPEDEVFRPLLAGIRAARERRFRGMAALLAEHGITLPEARLVERIRHGNAGRPHLAWLMIEAGAAKDLNEAFGLWLGEGAAAWLPKEAPATGHVIRTVQERGGLAVVAHPAKTLPLEAVPVLLDLGVDGLECLHPSHSRASVRGLRRMAEDRGCFHTAGSDYHGRPDRRESYLRPDMTLEEVGGELGERLRTLHSALIHKPGATGTTGAR